MESKDKIKTSEKNNVTGQKSNKGKKGNNQGKKTTKKVTTQNKPENKTTSKKVTDKVTVKKEINKAEPKKVVSKTVPKKVETNNKKDVKKIDAVKNIDEKNINEEKKTVKSDNTKKVAINEVKTEKVISVKTWMITILSVLVLLISIIAFSFNAKKINEENVDDYVYVADNKLMLWSKNNQEKVELSDNFIVESSTDFKYSDQVWYRISNNNIYFIDNINKSMFDLKYVIKDSKITNGKLEVKEIAKGINNYDVKKDTIVYVKDDKLYIYNIDSEIVNEVESFIISDNGKYVYYATKDNKVYSYSLDDKKSELVEENYAESIITLDNNLYTFRKENYLYKIYKNGELLAENVTDYMPLNDELIYYRYNDSLDSKFDELVKKYDESKITFEDIKNIINVNKRVLLYVGKPGCSYCSLLDEVFTKIKQTNKFAHVYINTSLLEDEELDKLLEFANVDSSNFGTPTLIVTENGNLITSKVGYMEEAAAKTFLEENGIFSSTFTYENKKVSNFTPDVMFMSSDTYRIVDGEEKMFTNGLLYISDKENLFDSKYQINFIVDKELDYSNISATDIYENFKLHITKTSNNQSKNTNINYADLEVLYLDNINDYLLYKKAADEKISYAKITNSKLKTKKTYENICSVNSTVYGTALITECNSNTGIGDLSLWSGISSKKVDGDVYQILDNNNNAYYIKLSDSIYELHSYKNNHKIDDVYYANKVGNEIFYYKQILVEEAGDDNEAIYSYNLYMVDSKNKGILIAEGIDFNFQILPIK